MGAAHPAKANRSHVVDHIMRLLGGNGADLTIEEGAFIKSVVRQGEGVYRITWQQDPGLFLGPKSVTFMSATMADTKGHTVTFDTWDATNLQLDFTVWDSTFAADDLLVNEWLTITIAFSEHGV